MIEELNGDLFKSDSQTIVNTINCVGVMGKGIAFEFKKRYPEMFERYKILCDQGKITIGKLWIYKTPDKWILNFPTKTHWREDSKIEYLMLGLEKFLKTYKDKGITSVSFPLLGANNGNIDPKVSLDIMRRYLINCDIPIKIFVK